MILWLKTQIKMTAAIAGIYIVGATFCFSAAAAATKLFGVDSIIFKVVAATLIIPALFTFLGALAASMIINEKYREELRNKRRRQKIEQSGPENPIPSGTSDAKASGVPDSRGL